MYCFQKNRSLPAALPPFSSPLLPDSGSLFSVSLNLPVLNIFKLMKFYSPGLGASGFLHWGWCFSRVSQLEPAAVFYSFKWLNRIPSHGSFLFCLSKLRDIGLVSTSALRCSRMPRWGFAHQALCKRTFSMLLVYLGVESLGFSRSCQNGCQRGHSIFHSQQRWVWAEASTL